MNIAGKRIRSPRWVHTDPCVVRVEVEAVIPDAEPSEPCFEPQTIKWLNQVHEHAKVNDLDWLEKVGRVYVRQSA